MTVLSTHPTSSTILYDVRSQSFVQFSLSSFVVYSCQSSYHTDLSLHDNKYIRYFVGHQKKVTSLVISPTDDAILSASMDSTVRMWDLRSPSCQGQLTTSGQPVANFDPEGLIFAVGINSEIIKLYDRRVFDKGAFSSFKKQQDSLCNWTDLKISPDSKSFLISTDGGVIHMIDSFKGTLLNTFTGHVNNKGLPLEACFSPDSQFVFCGSTDGKVHCWNANTGNLVMSYNTEHQTPIQCTKFNPKYFMLATAAQNLAFWIPNVTEE